MGTDDTQFNTQEIDRTGQRFRRIEGKLRLLVMLSIIQTVVIGLLVACLFIKQFMPSTLTLILMSVGLVIFLWVFRSQIPGWFGRASRFLFAQMLSSQKSDSHKDEPA